MVRNDPVCIKKRRYSDECQARAMAMESIQKNGGVQKLWVYQCPSCRGWHLTKNHKSRRHMVTADNPVFEPAVEQTAAEAFA